MPVQIQGKPGICAQPTSPVSLRHPTQERTRSQRVRSCPWMSSHGSTSTLLARTRRAEGSVGTRLTAHWRHIALSPYGFAWSGSNRSHEERAPIHPQCEARSWIRRTQRPPLRQSRRNVFSFWIGMSTSFATVRRNSTDGQDSDGRGFGQVRDSLWRDGLVVKATH